MKALMRWLRTWHLRRAQRRVAAALALLDRELLELHMTRQQRRQVFRSVVKDSRAFTDLAEIKKVLE